MTSVFIFTIISVEVLTGTKKPYHDTTLKPGTPSSAMVGTSGAIADRFATSEGAAAFQYTLLKRPSQDTLEDL